MSDKISYWIKMLFSGTYKMGLKLLEISYNEKIGCLWFFLLGLSCIFVKNYILITLFLITVMSALTFIAKSRQILLSLGSFLIGGTVYWFIITIMIMYCLFYSTGLSGVWLGYIIIFISWCFYSLLANNKVASAANQIHSTILALVVIMKDAIIYSIPESFLNEMTASGDTYERIIEMSFGAIFYPLLAINLMALLLCNLKGYWIEKYNHNQDISLYEDDNRCE